MKSPWDFDAEVAEEKLGAPELTLVDDPVIPEFVIMGLAGCCMAGGALFGVLTFELETVGFHPELFVFVFCFFIFFFFFYFYMDVAKFFLHS
jgi:hypothetical protein